LCYSEFDESFQASTFFTNHLKSFLQVYTLREVDASTIEFDFENFTDPYNTASSEIIEIIQELESEDQPFNLPVVMLLNTPMFLLAPISVKHHVWPGVISPYLKMYEQLAAKFICTFEEQEFLETAQLELLINFERAISYLFNGDVRKLGKSAIIKHTSLLNSLLKNNYPAFKAPFYDMFADKPKINFDSWIFGEEPVLNSNRFIDRCDSINLEIALTTHPINVKKAADILWKYIMKICKRLYFSSMLFHIYNVYSNL
jgi:hypothetical protein